MDKTISCSKMIREENEKDKWVSAQDLLDMKIVDVPKLWDPFLPHKGLAMLTGSSDCGKSILLRQLAVAIVQGCPEFLGYPLNPKAAVVYYVSTEDEPESLSAWLNKNIYDFDKKNSDFLEGLFFLCSDTPELVDTLDKKLSQAPADMVVIDTWADSFYGNPNNLVDVRTNLNELKALAIKHECLFVLLHHTVKHSDKSSPDKGKLNGSGAIEQKVRSLLELRKGDQLGTRYLSVLKNNYMSEKSKEESLKLSFDEDRLELVNTGDTISLKADGKGEAQTIYDKPLWVERMNKLRKEAGYSYEAARNHMITRYPGENIPSLTWFKINCKQ